MQKTITKDFLTHKATKNTGEEPKYYIKNHHKAIIDRITFQKVQALLNGAKIDKDKEKNVRKNPQKHSFHGVRCRKCGNILRRQAYTKNATGYKDERCKGYDKYCYRFSCPMWKCDEKPYYEVALEQSFMEMLYKVKREIESKGESAEIYSDFNTVKLQLSEKEDLKILDEKLKKLQKKLKETKERKLTAQRNLFLENHEGIRQLVLNGQLSFDEIAVDDTYDEEVQIYSDLCEDIQKKIDGLTVQKNELNDKNAMQENFDFFIECIKSLPDKNLCGMDIKVYGTDVSETIFREKGGNAKQGVLSRYNEGKLRITPEKIQTFPDILPFDKAIFNSFIEDFTLDDDKAEYKTNFGLTLSSNGNRRTLSNFLGFKKAKSDGTLILVDTVYKVGDNAIQFRG